MSLFGWLVPSGLLLLAVGLALSPKPAVLSLADDGTVHEVARPHVSSGRRWTSRILIGGAIFAFALAGVVQLVGLMIFSEMG